MRINAAEMVIAVLSGWLLVGCVSPVASRGAEAPLTSNQLPSAHIITGIAGGTLVLVFGEVPAQSALGPYRWKPVEFQQPLSDIPVDHWRNLRTAWIMYPHAQRYFIVGCGWRDVQLGYDQYAWQNPLPSDSDTWVRAAAIKPVSCPATAWIAISSKGPVAELAVRTRPPAQAALPEMNESRFGGAYSVGADEVRLSMVWSKDQQHWFAENSPGMLTALGVMDPYRDDTEGQLPVAVCVQHRAYFLLLVRGLVELVDVGKCTEG